MKIVWTPCKKTLKVNIKDNIYVVLQNIYKKVEKYSNKSYYNYQLYVYLNPHIISNQSINIFFKLIRNPILLLQYLMNILLNIYSRRKYYCYHQNTK